MGFSYRKCIFLQKNALSCRKMHFPAEKCPFLQKNADFCGAHGRKPQEITGGFQSSRIKNASQLSQEQRSLKKMCSMQVETVGRCRKSFMSIIFKRLMTSSPCSMREFYTPLPRPLQAVAGVHRRGWGYKLLLQRALILTYPSPEPR